MPTLAQVRTRVDDWLTARWPTVQNRQDAYFQAHDRYWQGLRTHAITPNHTTASFADSISDLLANHPTDQEDDWLDFLSEIENVAIPAIFVMDVYDGPEGQGYVGHVYAAHNGTVYHRAQNVGPESYRTQGWHEL